MTVYCVCPGGARPSPEAKNAQITTSNKNKNYKNREVSSHGKQMGKTTQKKESEGEEEGEGKLHAPEKRKTQRQG